MSIVNNTQCHSEHCRKYRWVGCDDNLCTKHCQEEEEAKKRHVCPDDTVIFCSVCSPFRVGDYCGSCFWMKTDEKHSWFCIVVSKR